MPNAATVRLQIEAILTQKIPSALTVQPKMTRPVVETGIGALDDLLDGGLPVGAISELIGPEGSGRTSVALSFLARITHANKVCAWIDVSNAFDPVSAAAVGVHLKKLLWVRCDVRLAEAKSANLRFVLAEKYLTPAPIKKGLHGGGFGPHPRTEVRGLSDAIGELFEPHRADQQHPSRPRQLAAVPRLSSAFEPARLRPRARQYDAIEQAIRSADLLLQIGGFSAVVLDFSSVAPEFVARIELSTWHRYRLAAERTQASILLLTQYPCAKSSSELQLKLFPAEEIAGDSTVFLGLRPQLEIVRQRYTHKENDVIPLRISSQRVRTACWETPTTWAVRR